MSGRTSIVARGLAIVGLGLLGVPSCYLGVDAEGMGDPVPTGTTAATPDPDSGTPDDTDADTDDGTGTDTDGPESTVCNDAPQLPQTIRGLNSRQYARTIEAVFPGISSIEDMFGDSDRSAEFSTSSQIRRLDFKTASDVIMAADTIATEAVASVSLRFDCLGVGPAPESCVRTVVEALSAELYRGPAPTKHVDGLVALFVSAQASSDDAHAMQVLIRAMLTSPRFLFRQEVGEPRADGEGFELTQYELASALSYTLTDAPPDAELRAAAAAGTLRDAGGLEVHASRLIAEQASTQSGMVAFVRELTGVRDLTTARKDEVLFPEFDEATAAVVLSDFEATAGAVLGSAEPTLERMLSGKEFVVSPSTARLLGWPDPEQYRPEDGLVEIDEPGRQGLLTHPAMLAVYSHEVETNPVARGHFLSGKLLCNEVPAPPEAVMFPDRDEVGANETLRETLERVHAVGSCAGCHVLMDPYGWPFEVFDAVGRRRDTDRGLPIDETTMVSIGDEFSGTVNNVSELLDVAAGSDLAHACVSRRAFKYVAGVGDELEGFRCIADELGAPFEEDGNIPNQFVRILDSRWFRERRAAP